MSTELATAPKKTLTVRDHIESDKFKAEIAKALPKHLTPDRFIRVAVSALTRTPKLKDCEQASLFGAMLTLSQMGIEPDGRRAHLIPFENRKRGVMECQLIIDYKGLAEMAMRSGVVSYLHADVVCENDQFDENMGEIITHKINRKAPRGEVYAAYAICKFKDGTAKAEVMSVDEIDAIRKRSRAGQSGPWVTDWNEMAKKTVFRRLSKWLPLSPEFRDAVEGDDDAVETPINVKPAKVVTPIASDDEVPFDFGQPAQPVADEQPPVDVPATTSAPVEKPKQPEPTKTVVTETKAPTPTSEPKPSDKPKTQPAQTELPGTTEAGPETNVEKLTRLATEAKIQWESVETWGKTRKLNPNAEADAYKIINAWTTVKGSIKANAAL